MQWPVATLCMMTDGREQRFSAPVPHLSADQFAENHLESNGVDVKRLKLEARSGILTWKWILEYPDQLWNRVEKRECRQQRHRWKFLQYLHLHLRQKNTCSRCKFTATAEEAMWPPRRRWWFATHPT